MADLILSLFPGIGLLDHAFESEGFCVVRGPDVIWGGDVKTFTPPSGVFAGVIGGPPCQPFSQLVHMVRANGYEPRHENLIPEFERIVTLARPEWYLMEEVPAAPAPSIEGYRLWQTTLNNRHFGAAQSRTRTISFGTHDGRSLPIEYAALEAFERVPAVTSSTRATPVRINAAGNVKSTFDDRKRRPISEMLTIQGFPPDFLDECPFTDTGKRIAVANGVPLPTGRALARAVRRAMYE